MRSTNLTNLFIAKLRKVSAFSSSEVRLLHVWIEVVDVNMSTSH